jgi:hypothetical protein
MVRAVGEELHYLDRLVLVSGVPWTAFVVCLEGGPDKGFADVGDTLIAKVVCELEPVVFGLVHALAAEKLQTFRVPCTTRERIRANVAVELQVSLCSISIGHLLLADGCLHKVIVAKHLHTADVELEFILIWLCDEDRERSSHL